MKIILIVLALVVLYWFFRRRKRKKLPKAEAQKTAVQQVVQVDHPEGKVNPHSMPKEDYTNLRPDVMRAAEREAEAALERDRLAGRIVPLRRVAARQQGSALADAAARRDTDNDGSAFAAAAAGAMIIGHEFGMEPATGNIEILDATPEADNSPAIAPDPTSRDAASDDDGDDDSSDSNDSD